MGIFAFRLVVVVLITVAGYFSPPFHLTQYYGAIIGLLLSIGLIYLETRIRKSQFKVIWGSTLGVMA
ncbi:MAG: PIN domain nuclease, partial [Acidobacteriota bacterium]|nr:PIN domain nuclease [Acidobacteriota bacterium]